MKENNSRTCELGMSETQGIAWACFPRWKPPSQSSPSRIDLVLKRTGGSSANPSSSSGLSIGGANAVAAPHGISKNLNHQIVSQSAEKIAAGREKSKGWNGARLL